MLEGVWPGRYAAVRIAAPAINSTAAAMLAPCPITSEPAETEVVAPESVHVPAEEPSQVQD